MSAARLLGAAVPVVLLLISVVGWCWVVRQERRRLSSYTRRLEAPAAEPSVPASPVEAGEARDAAVVDASEAARAAAAWAAEAVKRNALFHP